MVAESGGLISLVERLIMPAGKGFAQIRAGTFRVMQRPSKALIIIFKVGSSLEVMEKLVSIANMAAVIIPYRRLNKTTSNFLKYGAVFPPPTLVTRNIYFP